MRREWKPGLSIRTSRLVAVVWIIAIWWTVGMLAADGRVHPMSEVLWVAGAGTISLLYWLIIAHFIKDERRA